MCLSHSEGSTLSASTRTLQLQAPQSLQPPSNPLPTSYYSPLHSLANTMANAPSFLASLNRRFRLVQDKCYSNSGHAVHTCHMLKIKLAIWDEGVLILSITEPYI
jgi:hypothetical protein